VLQRLIASAPLDRDVRLTVLRTEGRRPLRVRLTSMPLAVAGDRVAAEFGFVLREPERQGELGGMPPLSAPPAVAVVIRGSAADKAGLEVDDAILTVNDRPVLTRDAAREALADASLQQPLRLTVRRGGGQIPLTLAPS
jgi:S1-C subfamily serine protease